MTWQPEPGDVAFNGRGLRELAGLRKVGRFWDMWKGARWRGWGLAWRVWAEGGRGFGGMGGVWGGW